MVNQSTLHKSCNAVITFSIPSIFLFLTMRCLYISAEKDQFRHKGVVVKKSRPYVQTRLSITCNSLDCFETKEHNY